MTMHTIPVGQNDHLAIRDDGAGTAVVLLHGIPGAAASWTAVARDLATDHRVIVPDLLGFGASSRPTDIEKLHAAGQALVLDRALEQLGVDRALVAGHDFGGPVALLLHRARPERVAGLLLAATNTFPDTPIPFPIVAVTWPVIGPVLARALFSRPALRLMTKQAVGVGACPVDIDAAVGDRAQASAIRRIFTHSLRQLAHLYGPIEAELARVDVPAAVLWGDRDPFFPVAQGERLTAALDGSSLDVVAGSGHFLPEEQPGAATNAIRALVRANSAAY
jgi:pimeloyl-ACP methyl ester carboxylesterase